jgi:predicted helicase
VNKEYVLSIQTYLKAVEPLLKSGDAREHAYRPALQNLLAALLPDILIINEPARVSCGAPDFVLRNKKTSIDVGYIEAKDIGKSLDHKSYDEQFERYRAKLPNLIITDYLEFRLYREGELKQTICISKLVKNRLVADPTQFDAFTNFIQEFAAHISETIGTPAKLADMMAGKARLLANVIEKALLQDKAGLFVNSSLNEQLEAFRKILIHTIAEREFADIYAQTIAYGLFAARIQEIQAQDFSRQKAASLIPQSNPFLRKLFQYVSGYEVDKRIEWIVDALALVFRHTDMAAVLTNFGKGAGKDQEDPIIHFYETFLAAYDPKLRKARGVWYTPQAVVNFIVRAVDDVLKDEFGLSDGLASNAKIKVTIDNTLVERHRVQILDPATGTGTFLAEVIRHIHGRFAGQEGVWNAYVERDLIPRLNGFELLMASYAMAHLQLGLLLQELGYRPREANERLKVYLTNTLESPSATIPLGFEGWLVAEANEANAVKRDAPVMVVLGNPPYSGESQNKSDDIERLMKAYKQEPGGGTLNERNGKWLNDDYVKFMRFAESFIVKNGEGILAYITNHSWLDNPTFRGMRWHLMESFDKIYVIDLHGNSLRREVSPDGSPDKNVFDIKQGVAIVIGVKVKATTVFAPTGVFADKRSVEPRSRNLVNKTGSENLAKESGSRVFAREDTDGENTTVPAPKKSPATVYHAELYGSRQSKYEILSQATLKSLAFTRLNPARPHMMFVPRDDRLLGEYSTGFSMPELFPVNSVGIVTGHDALAIHHTREELVNTLERFTELSAKEAQQEFNLGEDARLALDDLAKHQPLDNFITPITYRPFDTRWTVYTGQSNGFHTRPRGNVIQHMFNKDNIGILISRSATGQASWQEVQCTNLICEFGIMSTRPGNGTPLFPLYLYTSNMGVTTKHANFNPAIAAQIVYTIGTHTPENLFDYIYAILHSPNYRTRYAQFLKSDFPRIPYPTSRVQFDALAQKGEELRGLHLLESPKVKHFITKYPKSGSNIVTQLIRDEDANVWINTDQYFENVPDIAWNFPIGGYLPAQKWLKDRKNRELSFDDISHYQQMIVALSQTHRVMSEIDAL